MVWRLQFWCAEFAVVSGLICGCSESPTFSRLVKVIETKKVAYDLGVVREDINYRWQIPLKPTETKEVKTIQSGCGCTTVNVKEGDYITSGDFVITSIALSYQKPGRAEKSTVITFTDGAQVIASISYQYLPNPYCDPKYLLFQAKESKKIVLLVFPGETDVLVRDITQPSFLTCSLKAANEGKLSLTCKVNRENIGRDDDREGFITITTSSKQRPVLELPFAVLGN